MPPIARPHQASPAGSTVPRIRLFAGADDAVGHTIASLLRQLEGVADVRCRACSRCIDEEEELEPGDDADEDEAETTVQRIDVQPRNRCAIGRILDYVDELSRQLAVPIEFTVDPAAHGMESPGRLATRR